MKQIAAFLIVLLLLVPLTTSAQDFCEGNFDYDQDVDGSDASVFKNNFGRSTFKNPCPPDGPAPVAKTGQTLCYDNDGFQRDCAGTGEDGEYQRGVVWPTPRFTDNENGTVTDNLTGLTWLKDANCFGTRTWNNALSDANGLADGQCGLTDGSQAGDWRLPNRFELESLLALQNINPALPAGHPFTISQILQYYWSSTTHGNNKSFAWGMYMFDGLIANISKGIACEVWPARGGH
jgi:hypothetical protein